jgi:hypothetical protein
VPLKRHEHTSHRRGASRADEGHLDTLPRCQHNMLHVLGVAFSESRGVGVRTLGMHVGGRHMAPKRVHVTDGAEYRRVGPKLSIIRTLLLNQKADIECIETGLDIMYVVERAWLSTKLHPHQMSICGTALSDGCNCSDPGILSLVIAEAFSRSKDVCRGGAWLDRQVQGLGR